MGERERALQMQQAGEPLPEPSDEADEDTQPATGEGRESGQASALAAECCDQETG